MPATTRRSARTRRHPPTAGAASQPPEFQPLEPRLFLAADTGLTGVLWDPAAGGNGHRYEVVLATAGITWTAAQAEALARGGYLATLTSAEEDAFVYDLVDDPAYWFRVPGLAVVGNGPWIGAFRADTSLPAAEGWQWVTGEAWAYQNWGAFEPDKPEEPYAHFRGRGTLMADDWANRLNYVATQPVISYVVEYEPLPNAPPGFATMPVEGVFEGQAYEYQAIAFDRDGDALTITAAPLPAWLTLTDHGDGTATLAGLPGFAEIGATEVTLLVSDGTDTTAQSFTLEVRSIGQIAGVLWDDADRDGLRGPAEAPLPGWTVYLDADQNGRLDPGEAATVTDAEGAYRFHSVQPGDHVVRALPPQGEGWLERFVLSFRHRKQDFAVRLSDPTHFRRTPTADGALLLAFEAGNDRGFDELALRFTTSPLGAIYVERVDVGSPGEFGLRDTAGQVLLAKDWFRRGSVPIVALDLGWAPTTGVDPAAWVTTAEGQSVAGVNFGFARQAVTLATAKTAPTAALAEPLLRRVLRPAPRLDILAHARPR